jgi:Zn-dependent peptidase ImmA (M78 family)
MSHRNKLRKGENYIPRAKLIVGVSRLLHKISGPSSNILETLEKIRRIFPKLRIRVVADELLPDDEARAYPKRWLIKIRKGMHEGLLRGDARARWSLAHELAHILLQHPRSVLPRSRGIDSTDKYEREANLFAATFLAPYERAERCTTPVQIRDSFGISLPAAKFRFEELKRDRHRRKMAQERGLPHETFSIEAGYSSHLERQAALISSALFQTTQDFESKSILVEPLNSSLLGASLLTSTASHLLLSAYTQFRERSYFTPYQEAAALASAILTIQPLRGVPGTSAHSRAISDCNQQCARRAAAALLNLEFVTIDDAALPQPIRAARYSFEPSYLQSLLLSAPSLVDERYIISTLTNMPSREAYDKTNSLHEGEARELEFSASKLGVA